MPIHDWRRVEADIFHHLHHGWIFALSEALNRGILPPDHYALAEQIAGGFGPDVLTLEGPGDPSFSAGEEPRGGIALAEVEPKVSFRAEAELDIYAAKANRVVVHHVTDHRVVAMIEIVSPGNKSTRGALRTFVEKASELIRSGVHLLIIDLFPPTPRDPQGIHKAIWDELDENDFVLPPDRPLTLASYLGGPGPKAYIEPVAVGESLREMPLFLTRKIYVQAPLQSTYESAFDSVPAIWRRVLSLGDAEGTK